MRWRNEWWLFLLACLLLLGMLATLFWGPKNSLHGLGLQPPHGPAGSGHPLVNRQLT